MRAAAKTEFPAASASAASAFSAFISPRLLSYINLHWQDKLNSVPRPTLNSTAVKSRSAAAISVGI